MPFYALFRGAKTFLLVFYGGRFVNNVSERVNLSCSIGLESGAFIELRDQLVNFWDEMKANLTRRIGNELGQQFEARN